jgi:tetratricopeptide (TPR) repeat protein
MRNRFAILLFGVFAVPSVFAQIQIASPSTPLEGQPFSATAAELNAASAAAPADKQFPAIVLYAEGSYHIAADGTLDFRHRMIFRVDSADGVRGWSEISSNWDPWDQKPAQLHARVLQPDGHFTELDQKTITDAPINAEDSETFSSSHVRRAPLPGVTIGAIVEEVEEVEEKTPYFAAGGIYRFNFQFGVPVMREKVLVELPASAPFKDHVQNPAGMEVARSEDGGIRRVVYSASNVNPRFNSDINLNSNAPDNQMVEFSTGASWAAIASGYAALADPQTVTADALPFLPAGLPANRMERIQAIVQKLHHEVRYTGVEFGAARLTPQRPSEVINRHYGDCKDKANLLVAMLRAADIPAHLALLSVGPGMDVSPDLPGMSEFNHAIVYIPAGRTKAEPAIWIDATAEFFQVGSLPYDDHGRLALIVSPETKGLTQIPVAKPEDSVLTETRTFILAQNGPSKATEESETHGYIDANYRALYGGPETPKLRSDLEGYARNAYLARTLVSIGHGDGTDLSQPFHLKLEMDGAKRGGSSLVDAAVAIFPASTAGSLPQWFSTPPFVVGPETSEQDKRLVEIATQNRLASYIFAPFITEQRYRILVPDGYALRSLPAAKTTQLGTATLTETYSDSEPGVVTAVFRFNSGPGVLTTQQALDMRTAIVELHKRDVIEVLFDQTGAKLLAAGKIREALDADRALIASKPDDALRHTRLARALLDAGIGDAARAEAVKATELDPKSSPAFASLGWILEFDSLGVRFGKGFDRAGAIAALKRAGELDAEDNDSRFDLAILYEFNERGIRYGAGADLPAAIAAYKELAERVKGKDEARFDQYTNNLLYAMLFARQFKDIDQMLAGLPEDVSRQVVAISSIAAQQGAKAGIARADKSNGTTDARNKNLRTAATLLAELGQYPVAADLLEAGMQGDADAPTIARQIEMYRSLHKASLDPLPASDPASPVQTIVVGMMAGTLTHDQAVAALSHHAYGSPEALERAVQKNLVSSGFLRLVAEKSDFTEPVLLDLLAGNMKYSATGSKESGYVVITQSPGQEDSHYFVVQEDGAFRVVADDHDLAEVGDEVLYALGKNNVALAKAMLDWKRDQLHKEGGDDAFSGPLLTRFWTVGSSKPGADSPAAMRLAAISLLAGTMEAKVYLDEVTKDREQAAVEKSTVAQAQRVEDLDLLIATLAIGAELPGPGLEATKRLLEQEPDSITAVRYAGQAYAYQNDTKDWLALLSTKLTTKPKDKDLLMEQAHAYETAHDFTNARVASQKVLDSGKADSNSYNNYAWLGLFDNHLGEDATKAAQQSNMLSKNASFSDLHTMACVYAAQGKITEARQVLAQAMYAGSQAQPNSAVWYALGVIYEQYGAKDAALGAYRKVQAHELDDHTYVDPVDTYVLAQARFKALGQS